MTPPRIVSVPSGEDLLQALTAIEPECWLQANGFVEGVEIKLPGEATDLTRTLRGRLALLSLQGPSQGPWMATFARHTDVGMELLGGQLLRARSQGVLLFVQPAVSQQVPRDPEPRREIVAPPAARPSPVPAASAPISTQPRTWADVAAASEAAEDEESDELPQRGDLVDHFAFGLCEVLKANGDRLLIRDVKGPGRNREIAVSALRVMPPRTQNGKRCFRLQRQS